jgi:hypothetical protein
LWTRRRASSTVRKRSTARSRDDGPSPEKCNKKRWKILPDAARPVLAYLERAGIKDDKEGPLFRPTTPDATRLIRRYLDRKTPWRLG